MRELTRTARTYELMTILSPELPEETIPAAVDEIGGYITAAGGIISEVLRDSPWGRRRLAYPIRHAGRDVRDGYYTVYHVELAPGNVAEVERDLKLNERVIRYLVTQHTPQAVEPRTDGESADANQSVAVADQTEPDAVESAALAAEEPTASAAVSDVESDVTAAAADESEPADEVIEASEPIAPEVAESVGETETEVEAVAETEPEAEAEVEAVSDSGEEVAAVAPETVAEEAGETASDADADDEKPEG